MSLLNFSRAASRTVVEINEDAQVLGTYKSTSAAGKALGLDAAAIWTACHAKRMFGLVHGHAFCYEDNLQTIIDTALAAQNETAPAEVKKPRRTKKAEATE